jgi:RHS repeat-associated protein
LGGKGSVWIEVDTLKVCHYACAPRTHNDTKTKVIEDNIASMTVFWTLSSNAMVKYYHAGGQRIALRESGTLYYLFSDHLGSTGVSYRAWDGQTVRQLYTAWGQVRYNSGSLPTKYTFTGQYSYTGDFGLLFFNARWVDPLLGRFAQADSIVPNPGNPLDWDRYSYVRNNPLRYVDPSGHFCEMIGSNEICSADDDSNGWWSRDPRNKTNRHQESGSKSKSITKPRLQPASEYSVSPRMQKYLKKIEVFVPNLYEDGGGNCTIGYGHKQHSGPCNENDYAKYGDGISYQQADKLFSDDLFGTEDYIRRKIHVNISQNQFDALVSYAFNVATIHAEAVLDLVNNGYLLEAAVYMESRPITSNGITLPALIQRRRYESQLFLPRKTPSIHSYP